MTAQQRFDEARDAADEARSEFHGTRGTLASVQIYGNAEHRMVVHEKFQHDARVYAAALRAHADAVDALAGAI